MNSMAKHMASMINNQKNVWKNERTRVLFTYMVIINECGYSWKCFQKHILTWTNNVVLKWADETDVHDKQAKKGESMNFNRLHNIFSSDDIEMAFH